MKKKIQFSSVFFVLAFTFSIVCFLLATSMVSAKNLYNKRYSPENNKIISFDFGDEVLIDSVFKQINEKDLTVSLTTFISGEKDEKNLGYELITKLKVNEFDMHNNIVDGRYLTMDEFKGDKKIGLGTIGKDDINLISESEEKIDMEKIGTVSNESKAIVVPQKVFFDYIGTKSLANNRFAIFLSGEEDIVNETVEIVKKYANEVTGGKLVQVYSPVVSDTSLEADFLMMATGLIVLITVLNSVCISSLWVEDRKKELILRKVCGAKNRDIFKMFLKQLSVLAGISFVIAMGIYIGFLTLTNGVIFGIQIKLNLSSVMQTFGVTVLTTYIVAIPSMKYIDSLQLVEILREE